MTPPPIKDSGLIERRDIEGIRDAIQELFDFLEEVKEGRPLDKLGRYRSSVYRSALLAFIEQDELDKYIDSIIR